jgi:hypothetical protein
MVSKFIRIVVAAGFVVSSSAIAFAADTPPNSAPLRDKWALIVGISKFKDPDLNLKYPSKDAKDFAQFLVKEAHFAPDHVRVLTDEKATRERILDELGATWLPRVAAPGDLVLIYLSTHGSPSEMDTAGVNYIVAHDTDKERLFSTAIAMQDLCDIVKRRVHSDRALIIMDACHSGATTTSGGKGLVRPSNVDAEAIAQGTGQMVICSSSPNQLSWESKSAQNSVFTKRLIEGFKVKGADTSIGDTFDYVKKKVEEDVLNERGQLQTPVLKSKWEGDDLRVAALPVDPRPGINVPEPAPSVAPSVASKPAVVAAPAQPPVQKPAASAAPLPDLDPGKLAERALRDHFVRMAYGTPKEAYEDFAASIKAVTPFDRYKVNVQKQTWLDAVKEIPARCFKHVSATPSSAVILVDEQPFTGAALLWRYNLVKENGRWLIAGAQKITPAQWSKQP